MAPIIDINYITQDLSTCEKLFNTFSSSELNIVI